MKQAKSLMVKRDWQLWGRARWQMKDYKYILFSLYDFMLQEDTSQES